MKLKLDETILRCRREKGLTQEELAAALGVSPQSISNWEHGGYPDIELLPAIANFFEITVDELIGNDKISMEEDLKNFRRNFHSLKGEEALKFGLAYHRKYPNDYDIMSCLCSCIVRYESYRSPESMKLLRDLSERIIGECTDAETREDTIYRMCEATDGEEFERWVSMLPVSYGVTNAEIREDHFWNKGDTEAARRLYGRNNIALLLHFTGRDYHADGDAARAAENARYRMTLLACGENGEVPDGFLGHYAYYRLCYASALFGCGRTEEGFTELDGAVDDYLRSYELPDDVPLSVGPDALFHGICCIRHRKKGQFDQFVNADGTPIDYQVGNQSHHLNIHALLDMLTHGDFSAPWFDYWFDKVQNDERFKKNVERVKKVIEG